MVDAGKKYGPMYNWPYIALCRDNRSIFSIDPIIESVDSISRDERDAPLTQYITNAEISRARYTITYFKHHHRVLAMADFQSNECITSLYSAISSTHRAK